MHGEAGLFEETADKLARAMEKRVWDGISMEEVETLNAILTRCMGNLEG